MAPSIRAQQWNTEELADGIYQAMTQDDETRKVNHEKLFKYITKYTAAYWGVSFVNELVKIKNQEDAKTSGATSNGRKRKSSSYVPSPGGGK